MGTDTTKAMADERQSSFFLYQQSMMKQQTDDAQISEKPRKMPLRQMLAENWLTAIMGALNSQQMKKWMRMQQIAFFLRESKRNKSNNDIKSCFFYYMLISYRFLIFASSARVIPWFYLLLILAIRERAERDSQGVKLVMRSKGVSQIQKQSPMKPMIRGARIQKYITILQDKIQKTAPLRVIPREQKTKRIIDCLDLSSSSTVSVKKQITSSMVMERAQKFRNRPTAATYRSFVYILTIIPVISKTTQIIINNFFRMRELIRVAQTDPTIPPRQMKA